jgi:hypothetical protein
MIDKLIKNITDPDNPNFWSALSVVGAVGSFIGLAISKVINNTISKTTKITVNVAVELFLDWVKVCSKSEIVNDENVRIWISENGGSLSTGRSYLVFKKFIKELNRQGYKNIRLQEEHSYNLWVNKYEAIPKWSRAEW